MQLSSLSYKTFSATQKFSDFNNSKMPFTVRSFKPHQYEMVINWGNKQGANKGLYDYLAFRILDKQTFYMGDLDGQPVACLCGAQYDQNIAVLGLYYVKPQHRQSGYGTKIYQTLKNTKNITAKNVGANGSLRQQTLYINLGWKTHHMTIRYYTHETNKPYETPHLISCKDLDFQQLNQFDRKNFPGPRKEFLAQWITLPKSHSIAFVRNNSIEGYGVVRISGQGYKIGPLFAQSFQVAEQIFKNLIGFVPPMTKTTLDIPQINKDGMKLQQKFKMIRQFACVTMYTKDLPTMSYYKTVYGLTSLEFG